MKLDEIGHQRPQLKRKLSDDIKRDIIKDFKDWTGGFGPEDCTPRQIRTFVSGSLDTKYDDLRDDIHDWLDMVADGEDDDYHHLDD